ncbi:MAG: amidohydrolase [Thermoplasmata archaeon]|jgi:predicted amidohydrolase YtcJ
MTEAHRWTNGHVFTGRRTVRAVLAEGGRITAAGTEEEVSKASPTGVEVHDLQGHLVLPGLVDAHLHIAELTRFREGLDLRGIPSIITLVERIRTWVAAHPQGAVVGRGWHVEQFREGRPPVRDDLDRAVGDRPIILYHASGHAAVVNSAALAVAGLDAADPDPLGGRVGRNSDGTPNGLLYEEAMRPVSSLASAAFPPPPESLARTLRLAASLGLTTVSTMSTSPEELAALRALADAAALPVRVRAYVRLSLLENFGPSDLEGIRGDGFYGVPGVKAFADGAFGPRTGWLSNAYTDAPGEFGVPVGTEDGLAAGLARAAGYGLAPAVHAIGDRAVARVLRLLERVAGATRAPGRIEHAALTPPELLPAIDRVRPVLVVQPGFVWSDAWLSRRLGAARARWAYAFRTLADRGHLLAGSSDAPYDPLDPWRGLAACVARSDPEGRSANPDPAEAIPAAEAVLLYTANAGRALGEPDLGSLEVGARADLVLTAATDLPRAVAAGAAVVQETWVDGRPVPTREGSNGQ